MKVKSIAKVIAALSLVGVAYIVSRPSHELNMTELNLIVLSCAYGFSLATLTLKGSK